MKTDTPRTDAALVWARVVDQSDHAPPHEQMVYPKDMEQLEREITQWREMAGRLAEAIRWTNFDACQSAIKEYDALAKSLSDGGKG